MVRQLLADGRDLEHLTLPEWRAFSTVFDADVLQAITPEASVAVRKTPQSTAPAAVERALADVRSWLSAHDGK